MFLRQPINFVYAVFAITLIGGTFTVYIAKASYESFANPYLTQGELMDTNDNKDLN